MTENIIFDFGNVLVQWHPELIYGEYFGDEAKAWWFLRHVADNEWRLRVDSGESMEACIRELQARRPDYAEAIELYRSKWREMLTGEVPGMRELLNELLTRSAGGHPAPASLPHTPSPLRGTPPNLGGEPDSHSSSSPSLGEGDRREAVVEECVHPSYQVYGLTNWSMETFPEAREHFAILQLIDRYVVSGAEGYVKPDPRLFRVLLDRYRLRADECTFIDDNPTNVAAAEALGMRGIVFTDAENLRKELAL